jgi:hypothetical protein
LRNLLNRTSIRIIPPLQFKDVRLKARFIKTRIVARTSNNGITADPKAAAKPIIHKTMATVKIVQNTELSLNAFARF